MKNFEDLPEDWQRYIRGVERALNLYADDLRTRKWGAKANAEESPTPERAAVWTAYFKDLEAFEALVKSPTIDEIRDPE